MNRLLERLERYSRGSLIAAGLMLLVLIGLVDYLTGFEIMFSVFYLLEVGLAAWFVGRGFGLLMAVLSIAAWIGGDVAAGAHYSTPLIPIWNALIPFEIESIKMPNGCQGAFKSSAVLQIILFLS